ncbi:hypothetical protein D9M73_280530 [compost metagenome]
MNKEPAAMPNSPALNSRPIWAPFKPHSADTEEAVKAITSTSKPSIMFRTIQMPTANHWKCAMGRSSTTLFRSTLMAAPREEAG